jgi:outer membrane protein insertion porin family
MIKRIIFTLAVLFFIGSTITAQIVDDKGYIDYGSPAEYVIKKISFSGAHYTDTNICRLLTGLYVGEEILVPGEKISYAIENLWKQGLFDDIKVFASKFEGNSVWLEVQLKEHPRLLSAPLFSANLKKSEVDDLRGLINLSKGDVITSNVLLRTKELIKNHFIDKGFYNTEVSIRETIDSSSSKLYSKINIDVDKNKKVRIRKINFEGNDNLSDFKLKNLMKKTKEKTNLNPFIGLDTLVFQSIKKLFVQDSVSIENNFFNYLDKHFVFRIFKGSKFLNEEYIKDKAAIIAKYNELGYRDSKISIDTIVKSGSNTIDINLDIDEGHKFYFRNITWTGNTKYTDKELSSILKINKGDVFNQKSLETNLSYNPNGFDVYSLYMDNGYLFFNATPIETNIENDSIDLEIRITEGKQAYINKVTVKGNTKTNDYVILREVRTKPGQLFSRADVIRTTRELAQLNYFNQEKIVPDIVPNPTDGTVDIEYSVEEKSSDQLELSGGWGMGTLIGTLGVSFNNFSTKNFFKKSAWQPLPSGDGQKLSIRFQTNGKYYQAYNASFTEPWLGGKKPQALSVSAYYSMQSNGVSKSNDSYYSIKIFGASVGLGNRLTWPDDYFTLYNEISFRNYEVTNYPYFTFKTGYSNNLNYTITLSRNSIDAPIFPRSGSEISGMVQVTPPYSLFNNKDYSTASDANKYRWLEYYKWKITASIYTKLSNNLVFSARTKFGYLGYYNKNVGIPPFERFYLGGDGLSGFSLDGRELIALRGYSNNSLTPEDSKGNVGGSIFDKLTLELRYLVSPNPMATIYLLGFAEGGNAWSNIKEFNPFSIYRSAGVGVRVYLPMFGLLGLDAGYGFDKVSGSTDANKWQFHFSINQSID